jgi:hypothetical protein
MNLKKLDKRALEKGRLDRKKSIEASKGGVKMNQLRDLHKEKAQPKKVESKCRYGNYNYISYKDANGRKIQVVRPVIEKIDNNM